jgi:hypothetical protein
MGSDRTARLMGAGKKVTIGDQEYTIRPLTAKHLCEVEVAGSDAYKKERLRSVSMSKDFLPEEEYNKMFQREMENITNMDLSDLPQKRVFDVSKVPVTDKLKKWVIDKTGQLPEIDESDLKKEAKNEQDLERLVKEELEKSIRAVVNTYLDQGELKPDEVKELAGKKPSQGMVRYDQWWVTASFEGMATLIAASLQLGDNGHVVTKKDVLEWPVTDLSRVSREVEKISAADVKNT